jgi:hypothetical protein
MDKGYGDLTDSEKVIFSTFYAIRYFEQRRKFYNQEGVYSSAASAAEEAIHAVTALRGGVSELREGYGKKYVDVVLQIVSNEKEGDV